MPDAQRVVLQAQGLFVHVVQDGQYDFAGIVADLKVLEFWIVCMPLLNSLSVAIPEQVNIVYLVLQVLRHLLHHILLLGHVLIELLLVSQCLPRLQRQRIDFLLPLLLDPGQHILRPETDAFLLLLWLHSEQETHILIQLFLLALVGEQAPFALQD